MIRQSLITCIVDQELAAKLGSELAVEKEIRDLDQLPPSLKDFLDNSPFKVRSRCQNTNRN